MRINCFILLLIFTSCFSTEENSEEIKSLNSNVDSLFLPADRDWETR